jgi:uncharacterized protein (AIM24 family)
MMSSSDETSKKKNDDEIPEAEIVLELSGWHKLQIPSPDSVNYAITGHESQVLTMKLLTGQAIQGEPGTMMYLSGPGMNQHVTYEGCCERLCSGEDCFIMNFTNNGHDGSTGFAALSPNFPTAKIVPIDMSSPHVNGTLIAQSGAFMASYGDVSVGVSLDCNCVRCCCSGLGLVRQKLVGTGTVFLAGTGTIVQKVLAPDETIIIDSNCIMAYADSCTLDLKRAGGVLGIVGGGEGIFNTTLKGPGLCIVQSMNEIVFREALIANKLYRR